MLEAHRRLRRAAEIIATPQDASDRERLLHDAWELLVGLRSDDFPPELRPRFDYLRHEMSRLRGEQLTAREVNFLMEKIRELELQWIEPPKQTSDSEQSQM
jgi:hypothetical protein